MLGYIPGNKSEDSIYCALHYLSIKNSWNCALVIFVFGSVPSALRAYVRPTPQDHWGRPAHQEDQLSLLKDGLNRSKLRSRFEKCSISFFRFVGKCQYNCNVVILLFSRTLRWRFEEGFEEFGPIFRSVIRLLLPPKNFFFGITLCNIPASRKLLHFPLKLSALVNCLNEKVSLPFNLRDFRPHPLLMNSLFISQPLIQMGPPTCNTQNTTTQKIYDKSTTAAMAWKLMSE